MVMLADELLAQLEALLFAAGDPVSCKRLAEIMELSEREVAALLDRLREELQQPARGVMLQEVAGGFQLTTKPVFQEALVRLGRTPPAALSPAALETLAIIAFRQPVTKAEIEQLRGVKVDSVLNTLLERDMVKELGRREAAGRPILYGTTNRFLQAFGLKSLQDLPAAAAHISTAARL